MLNHGILTRTLVATVPPRSSERFRDPRIVCLPRNDDVPLLPPAPGHFDRGWHFMKIATQPKTIFILNTNAQEMNVC